MAAFAPQSLMRLVITSASLSLRTHALTAARQADAISLCDMHAKYADVMPAREIGTFIASLADGLFPNLREASQPQAGPLANTNQI